MTRFGDTSQLSPAESGILGKLTAWLIAAGLIVPIVVVIGLAFAGGLYLEFPPDLLSLDPLQEVISSSEWRRAFTQSVLAAAFAAPLATALATAAALGVRRTRHGRLIQTVMILPLIVPLIVTALAIYPVFSDFGLVGRTQGIVFAHALIALPFAFLTVYASVRGLDPQLERAAASLGASWFQTLARVTLPLMLPAIIASLIVSLAVSFDEVVLSLYVSSPRTRTVPILVFARLREDLSPEVAAAALLIVCVNIGIMVAATVAARVAIERRRSLDS